MKNNLLALVVSNGISEKKEYATSLREVEPRDRVSFIRTTDSSQETIEKLTNDGTSWTTDVLFRRRVAKFVDSGDNDSKLFRVSIQTADLIPFEDVIQTNEKTLHFEKLLNRAVRLYVNRNAEDTNSVRLFNCRSVTFDEKLENALLLFDFSRREEQPFLESLAHDFRSSIDLEHPDKSWCTVEKIDDWISVKLA